MFWFNRHTFITMMIPSDLRSVSKLDNDCTRLDEYFCGWKYQKDMITVGHKNTLISFVPFTGINDINLLTEQVDKNRLTITYM